MLKIEVNIEGALKKLNGAQDALKKDLPALINEAAELAAGDIRSGVTSAYSITDADVRGSMRRRKATSKLEANIDLWASPRKRGRALNLIHFLQNKSTAGTLGRSGLFGTASRADEKKRQEHAERIKVEQLNFLIRRGVIKQVPGAFVANKGRTVFRRVGKSRLPIEPVQTIGVSRMFNSRAIRDAVLSNTRTFLERRIAAKLFKDS
jgi:hypothetical protein